MSEHENMSGGTERVSPVLMVESASSKNNAMPRKPTDLRDERTPNVYQKRAPAVTPLAEKLKSSVEDESKDLKENENAISAETQKQGANKMSTNISNKRRGSSPAVIPMVPIEPETKPYEMVSLPMPAPIPTQVVPVPPPKPHVERKKDEIERKSDVDSITSEIVEMRTPEATKKTPEWSDDDEAGGLPRSESRSSRASRVTRAMRHLLCCGVRLEAPSEDNMSSPRSGVFNSGI